METNPKGRRRPLRHGPEFAMGLSGVAAIWVVGMAWSSGSYPLLSVGCILAASAGLQWFLRHSGGVAVDNRTPTASPPSDHLAPAGNPDPQSLRDLRETVSLPLHSLRHLVNLLRGREGEDPDRVLETLEEESTRLCDRLSQWTETSAWDAALPPQREVLAATPMLERVLGGLRSVLQSRDLQVRVLVGHRRDRIRVDRSVFFDSLAALLSELLLQIPVGSTILVRTKEQGHFLCVSAVVGAEAEAGAIPLERLSRAAKALARFGGECWRDVDREFGFGVAAPLARRGTKPRSRRPSEHSGSLVEPAGV